MLHLARSTTNAILTHLCTRRHRISRLLHCVGTPGFLSDYVLMIRALLDLYDLEVFFGAQSGRGGHGSDDSNSKRGCASEAGHLNQENPSSGGAQRRIKVDARAARYLDWALELQETQDQQFWDTS